MNTGSISGLLAILVVLVDSYLYEQSRLNLTASFTAAVIVAVSILTPTNVEIKSVVPNSKLVLSEKLGTKSVSVYVCVKAPELPASAFAPKTPNNQ